MASDLTTTNEQQLTKEKPKAITAVWRDFVNDNMKLISVAMPKIGITPESVARTALSQMYRNPLLMECDRTSVIRAIVEAASLGLTFALGRAYLVPFNNRVKGRNGAPDTWRREAQLIPGYQGLVDLVRRSSGVKTVLANAVYDGDVFNYAAGLTEDHFEHVSLVEPEDKKLTHAYCIIRFLDGGYQWVVLTRKQIDAVRARSKSKDNGPWVTDYAAMAIKTAVRRCTKLCPASIELVRALELDEKAERGESQDLGADILVEPITEEQESASEEPPPPESKADTLAAKLGAPKQPRAARAQPQPPAEEPPQKSDAERIEYELGMLANMNRAEANILLSEATGGKLVNLDSLAADLAERPGWIEIIDAFIERRKGGVQ